MQKADRAYLRIFRWHVWRYPLLGLLNILSVALGVAVYLPTQIANQSANRAFAATVDLVAGKAELEITAAAGHLPETILPELATVPGISAATPISVDARCPSGHATPVCVAAFREARLGLLHWHGVARQVDGEDAS